MRPHDVGPLTLVAVASGQSLIDTFGDRVVVVVPLDNLKGTPAFWGGCRLSVVGDGGCGGEAGWVVLK